jgi:PAS domain S-box-containing protein
MAHTRILVVEDDSIIAEDLQDRLRDLGYAVAGVAASGEEAVSKATHSDPDLVLMDIRLRGRVDGIEAAKQIRQHLHIPVVYLTSHADHQTVNRAKATEPFGYLLKPVHDRELRPAIEMAIYKHRMERKLKESEQWFSTTLRSIGDAVIATDRTGRVIFLNSSAELLTGWKHQQALGNTLTDVFHVIDAETRQPTQNPVDQVLQCGQPVAMASGTMLVGLDGVERLIADSAGPILDEQGRISGVVLVFHDITAQRRFEEQLRQALKMEAVGRLAGGVAHDFNNLLTIINSYSELLREALDSEDPRQEHVTAILRAGERAAGLTRRLLAFSRKQILRPVIVDLNQIVIDTAKMLARSLGENIKLETLLEPALRRVRADPAQIEQVIVNLALNSRDAMPAGGRLTLATTNVVLGHSHLQAHPELQPGPYVVLTLTDTGTGMDEVALAHIFEPFFTTKEVGMGTGLGLAMVYGIIKQSKGYIYVASQMGHGTTVTIYLPALEQALTPVESTREAEFFFPRGSETILLVEDEPGVRGVAQKVLQQSGYTILEANNGVEALAVCEQHLGPIDLVITDVIMPEMSGPELVRQLSLKFPGMRSLFISGYTANALISEGMLADGVQLLEKPFTLASLAKRVREVLNRSDS